MIIGIPQRCHRRPAARQAAGLRMTGALRYIWNMRTDLPICRTCGIQYAEPRSDCPVCLDERQYVGWDGQEWTTLAALSAAGHRARIAAEGPGGTGVGADPP